MMHSEASGQKNPSFSTRRKAMRFATGSSAGQPLQLLIISGWIIALLYFPSGFLHSMIGAGVYLRDLLLGVHLAASIIWLTRRHEMGWVAQHSWVILITPVLLIPAVIDHDFTVEALRTCKWSLCWLDWILLGHFLRLNRNWGRWWQILLTITAGEMVLEWLAGMIEWQSGKVLISSVWDERTAFGVLRGNVQYLQGQMRIRGLQRDVFSFSNLMAMNTVVGMALLVFTRKPIVRIGAAIWIPAFAGMMIVSGGRSSLFGAFAAAVYTTVLLLWPAVARRWSRWYVLAWVVIALVLSCIGVGKFTDAVGGMMFGKSYVGDSESAFMRDAFWVKMFAEFGRQPLILVFGGPFAKFFDGKIDTMFHWADNQLLWNLYHTGLVGALATALFFYKILEPEPRAEEWPLRHALVLFLCFVIGEGIARESMTFMGCLPLFVLCGYSTASEMRQLAKRGGTERIQRPSHA
jgi:hypothetical protein